jgi:hypothetical protein
VGGIRAFKSYADGYAVGSLQSYAEGVTIGIECPRVLGWDLLGRPTPMALLSAYLFKRTKKLMK